MKVYKTEIRPNKEQIGLIHQTFGNVRYVSNQFITLNFERLSANEGIISGYCNTVHDRDVNASINLEQCSEYTVLTAV